MAFGSDHTVLLERLADAVHRAPQPTVGLFSKIIAGGCTRIPVVGKSAVGIGRLVELGAWTDAALALIDLELPGWKLRRLACESGEWFCSLSRQANLPATLDDAADANHESMALAILLAFLEARRRIAIVPQPVASVPAVGPAPAELICCDNFA